jgi:hypothetical protein
MADNLTVSMSVYHSILHYLSGLERAKTHGRCGMYRRRLYAFVRHALCAGMNKFRSAQSADAIRCFDEIVLLTR